MDIYVSINEADIKVEPDGDMWTSYCDKLGLDSFGRTEEEAKENLSSVIAFHLGSLMEKGVLLDRMREKGISIVIKPAMEQNTIRHSRTHSKGMVLV